MAYTEHQIIKPQEIVDLAVGLLDRDMTLAKLITHEGIDKFKGKQGDKVVFRVPGRLPARDYEWRTRNNPIIFDVYKEATTDITFSGRAYSAVELTDEQADFDFGSWTPLIGEQTRAVGVKLNTAAANAIVNAPYEFIVGLGGNESALLRGILEMRNLLNKLRVPNQGRILVVGADVETELLLSEKMTAASSSETRAENALGEAIIGRIYGFNVAVDATIPADEAYAFVPSGFVLNTAAPSIPQSVAFGQTASFEGFALRWLRDYNMDFVKDRSLVDVYYGTNHVLDTYLPYMVEPGTVFDPETLTQHFVRGVKLTMSGASATPALATAQDLYAEVNDGQQIAAFVPPAA